MLTKLYEFKAGKDGIKTMIIHNNILYSAGEDDFIRSFNLNNYQLISEIKAHDQDVNKLKIYNNNLFSVSNDGTIKQWDLNLKLINQYGDIKNNINDIDFIDNKIIVGCDDGTIKVFKINSSSKDEINPKAGDINAVKVIGKYIFAGGSKLIIYDNSFKKLMENDNYIYGINLIKTTLNKIFIATSMEKYLEVWDNTMKLEKRIKIKNWVNDIEFYNDKIYVVNSNIISIMDLNYNIIEENDSHQQEIYSILFYNNKIITASNDSFIRIWEVK